MVLWANNIALTWVRVRRWRVLIGLWRSTFVTESFFLGAIEIGFGWFLLRCAWLHDSPRFTSMPSSIRTTRCHVCALTDAIVSRSVPSSGFQLRRILELARSANPRIDTAVRTHSVGELAYLERQGVGAAIMGAREFAFGLTDYALRSLGITESKARAIAQESRMSGEGGAFERRP